MDDHNLIENKSTNQIKKGAIVSYLSIIFTTLSGLLYTPWMIEQIGQNNYSLYILANSIIIIFTIDFGLSSAITRFVSKYNAEKSQNSVNNFLGIVYKIFILISIIISIVLIVTFFLLNKIYIQLTIEELKSFKIVYIIISLFTVINFPFISLNGILTSYEQFYYMKLTDLFNKIGTVLFIIIALTNGLGLYALVTINAVFNLLASMCKLIIIKKKTPVKINIRYKDTKMLKSIINYSFWITLSNIAQRLIFNITPTILGIVSNTKEIAFFGLVITLESYVYTISYAINGMFLPKVSRILVNDDKENNLLILMTKLGRINLSIIGIIVIGFAVIGKEFVILWMGEEYLTIYYCVTLLILPTVIDIPQQIANNAVIAMNKVKYQTIILIVTGIINVILSFTLSRVLGAFGASLSICFVYFIRVILLNILYYKKMGINIFVFFKECHIKMILGLIITLFLSMIFVGIINIDNLFFSFIIKTIGIIFIYFIVMWITAWNKYEKNMILSLIKVFRK